MSSGGIDMASEWFASKVCSHGAHSGVLLRGRGPEHGRSKVWFKSKVWLIKIESMVAYVIRPNGVLLLDNTVIGGKN